MADCLNCGEVLGGRAYCGACGQRATGRLRLGELAREFTAQLADWNLPWPRTLRDVTLRPGQTARAYVDGRRSGYVSPPKYAFYALVLAAAVAGLYVNFDFLPVELPAWRRRLAAQIPLFLLLMTPVSAACLRIAYWRSRYSLTEVAVLSLYMLGQLALIFVLGQLSGSGVWGFAILIVLIPTYLTYAAVGFFGGRVDHALVAVLFASLVPLLVAGTLYRWLIGVG